MNEKENFIQFSQIDLELFQVRGYQLKLNQNETRLPVRGDIHIQSIVLEASPKYKWYTKQNQLQKQISHNVLCTRMPRCMFHSLLLIYAWSWNPPFPLNSDLDCLVILLMTFYNGDQRKAQIFVLIGMNCRTELEQPYKQLLKLVHVCTASNGYLQSFFSIFIFMHTQARPTLESKYVKWIKFDPAVLDYLHNFYIYIYFLFYS